MRSMMVILGIAILGQLFTVAVFGESYPQIAYRYEDAKFAYCSTQGFGTLIDFQNYNLAKAGKGVARIGYKTCNTSETIQWSKTTSEFVVELQNGLPQINFPKEKYETYIHPYGNQTGSRALQGSGAPASMGYNSGECFFFRTAEFSGYYFIYQCK
jgi:hypothetical protein